MKKKCLNFGCGNNMRETNRTEEWDNCDIQKEAPISFDFNKFPYSKLKDNYYDYVIIEVVLENLHEPTDALYEVHKKCKEGAIIEIFTPFWNNKGAWSDPHVKRGFNEMYFEIIADQRDCYFIEGKPKFEIEELELTPTQEIGRFVPKWFREKLSTFIGGLIMHIHVKYEVIK